MEDIEKVKFDQKANDYGFTYDDLDLDALNDFIKAIKEIKKIPLFDMLDDMDILNRIGATAYSVKDQKLVMTNGAIAFFGKTYAVNTIYPSLWFDYQEKNQSSERFSHRINNKDIAYENNIYNFYRRVYLRLFENLPSPFYLMNGVNVGKTMVVEVVREALANAISNVELFSPLGLCVIKTSSSLSIRNAGGFLTGIEQALKGGISIPRNPSIFNYFLALGVSDHGGYGIPSIFSKMKLLKMMEPELKEDYNRDATTLILNFTQIDEPLSSVEQKILTYLGEHLEGVSSSMVADYLSCSNEKARQLLVHLVEIGYVKDNNKSNKGKLYFLNDLR